MLSASIAAIVRTMDTVRYPSCNDAKVPNVARMRHNCSRLIMPTEGMVSMYDAFGPEEHSLGMVEAGLLKAGLEQGERLPTYNPQGIVLQPDESAFREIVAEYSLSGAVNPVPGSAVTVRHGVARLHGRSHDRKGIRRRSGPSRGKAAGCGGRTPVEVSGVSSGGPY
jgi:hypothetical protein